MFFKKQIKTKNLFDTPAVFLGFAIFLLAGCEQQSSIDRDVNPEALFVFEVLPILEAKCFSCHGNDAEKIEGGLNLRVPQNILVGGDSGEPAVVPGKPHKSPLYLAIQRVEEDKAMPPKEGERLSDQEIQRFRDWIKMGAPWPDKSHQEELLATVDWDYGDRMPVATVGGQSSAWDNRLYQLENLWAFFPIDVREVPWDALGTEDANPIDAFLQEKRNRYGLEPAPLADKKTLVRRAYFDLLGLPPTPTQIEEFLKDKTPEAFPKLIDRLLESHHYGEQWGRHWLDVVRYADSGGFSNDYVRPNAWRYRDYVIRAFNQDKPYDQFVREQIAGDEIDPDDPEMLIAAGFLRMGPWEHTSMSVPAVTRQTYLDDVTNIVGETFLSTPLNCAKCHDHKYDPISTKDYYRIQAVFATTQFARREAPFLPEENVDLSNSEQERIADWIEKTAEEQKVFVRKEEAAAKEWYRERGLTYLPKRQRRKLPEDQQPPRYIGLTLEELGYRKVLNKRLQVLRHVQDRFKPLAYSVYNGPTRVINSGRIATMPEKLEGEPQAVFVLNGGSVYARGEEVTPGVMSAISSLQTALDGAPTPAIKEVKIPQTIDKRRLTFAKWLTDPKHPITARSFVNRVWQYHFGEGIAATPNNFGATGRKPTHPELLDWLTNYFIENGWSVKALHRLIMTSETYQLSSRHPEAEKLQLVDPDNKWLAFYSPRRLEAEELRDAMLLISGELNLEVGGFPIRPEINQEVALQPRHIMGSISQAYQPSRTPQERNRRSIYAEKYRSFTDPLFEVFNQPGTDLSCEKRASSTVTPQVFALFNGDNTRDRALALARDVQKQTISAEEQISLVIQRIWGRPATEREIIEAQSYISDMSIYHQENPPIKQSYPTEVRREMFEEMTGKPFEYTEELDIYKDYAPDLKPWNVQPETRALADFAAVCFNANEFVYLY